MQLCIEYGMCLLSNTSIQNQISFAYSVVAYYLSLRCIKNKVCIMLLLFRILIYISTKVYV